MVMVERARPVAGQARAFFERGQRGNEFYHRALITHGTPQAIVDLRSSFGEGNSGRKSFFYVAIGTPCEALGMDGKDNTSNPKFCRNRAVGSVDFDIRIGDEEKIFFCNDEHKEIAYKGLLAHPDSRICGFGENGRGRS